MRFQADLSSGSITIRGYTRGAVTINDTVHREAIAVSAIGVAPLAPLQRAAALTLLHATSLLAAEPQIVLVGTPHADDWPSVEWRAHFLSRGIGVEVMNTGAACRTYTVLVSERRPVVAVLLP